MFKRSLLQSTRSVSGLSKVAAGRRYAHAPAKFNWEDPLASQNLFTEEEIAIQETARSYCQERMLPRVLGMR
jgi:glutaryl-CoA dehydrogenase